MPEKIREHPRIVFVAALLLGSILIVISFVFIKTYYYNVVPAEIKIGCPVAKEFCSQGKIISNGESFYGISFTLPVDTPLLAVFLGQLSDQPKIPNRPLTQPLLYLKNNKGLEATYSFFGSSTLQSKNYTAGEKIGTIGKGQFPAIVPFGGSNLLLSLKQNGQFVKFTFKITTK